MCGSIVVDKSKASVDFLFYSKNQMVRSQVTAQASLEFDDDQKKSGLMVKKSLVVFGAFLEPLRDKSLNPIMLKILTNRWSRPAEKIKGATARKLKLLRLRACSCSGFNWGKQSAGTKKGVKLAASAMDCCTLLCLSLDGHNDDRRELWLGHSPWTTTVVCFFAR
ncbi:MAG: hypothetical protein AAFY99_00475 [Pseudomonadota bacterium]